MWLCWVAPARGRSSSGGERGSLGFMELRNQVVFFVAGSEARGAGGHHGKKKPEPEGAGQCSDL